MKNRDLFKYIAILNAILLCHHSCNSDDVDAVVLNDCGGELVKEFVEPIPVTVKRVEDNQPFYDGSKIYYEVDAETYFPEIFSRNGRKEIRLFPTNKISRKIGAQIKVKGSVTSCLTGNHGRLTDDLRKFYLLEQP